VIDVVAATKKIEQFSGCTEYGGSSELPAGRKAVVVAVGGSNHRHFTSHPWFGFLSSSQLFLA
jgi:hypothetical protein